MSEWSSLIFLKGEIKHISRTFGRKVRKEASILTSKIIVHQFFFSIIDNGRFLPELI